MMNTLNIVRILRMVFQKMASILYLLLTLSASSGLAEVYCIEIFNKQKTVRGEEKTEKRSDFFSYRDETYDFRFDATLRDGELLFFVQMINEELGVRSALRGSLLYDQMMKHFGIQNISEIKAIWQSGTNLKEFYENLDKGLNETEAILSTWSGRQAQKYGFTKVHYYEFFENAERGAKPGVQAIFTRADYQPIELD